MAWAYSLTYGQTIPRGTVWTGKNKNKKFYR